MLFAQMRQWYYHGHDDGFTYRMIALEQREGTAYVHTSCVVWLLASSIQSSLDCRDRSHEFAHANWPLITVTISKGYPYKHTGYEVVDTRTVNM